MSVEIKEHLGEGYMPLIDFNSWRVAIANYKDSLQKGRLEKLEKHLDTDEVFILLDGEATLYIDMEMKECPMKIGKLYNVKQNTWHAISMEKGSKVAIIENADTGSQNTQYYYFNEVK